jgi:hypothetical protein
MKQTAAALNLFVPSDSKASSPFVSSFVTGLVFSPLLNVFRMLQLGRIRGERYAALVRFFFTPAGARLYVHNTLLFAPGQGLGMMACFGSKDFLIPFLGGYKPPRKDLWGAFVHCAKLAAIAGPAVAVVETTVAVVR